MPEIVYVQPLTKKICHFLSLLLAFGIVFSSLNSIFLFPIFVIGAIWFSVYFPWRFGPLEKESVDVIYYLLGIAGVSLFFMAEFISQREQDLRAAIARKSEVISMARAFSNDIKRNVTKELTGAYIGFEKDLNFVLSAYYRENLDRYFICETDNEKEREKCLVREKAMNYARIFQGSIYESRRSGWFSVIEESKKQNIISKVVAEEIFKDGSASYLFTLENGHLVSMSLPAFTIWKVVVFESHKVRSGGPFSGKTKDEIQAAVQEFIEAQSLRKATLTNRLEKENYFGNVTIFGRWLKNGWPYLIVIALCMKLARVRIMFFKAS